MKKFSLTLEDGSVSIMILVDATSDKINEEIKKWQEVSVKKLVSFREVSDSDLPSREFRNAWVDTGTKVAVHAARAKDLQLQKVRAERDPLLKESDVMFTRALESGDVTTLNKTKSYRQALRDITEPLKALQTGEIANDAILQQIRTLCPSTQEEIKGNCEKLD